MYGPDDIVKCPKCGSEEITAYTSVIGTAIVLVNEWEVDDVPECCEPYDEFHEIEEFHCYNCCTFDNEGM